MGAIPIPCRQTAERLLVVADDQIAEPRQVCEPGALPDDLAAAAREATAAMGARPDMVGGTDRLDTSIMELTAGRLIVKTGANGYYLATAPAESF